MRLSRAASLPPHRSLYDVVTSSILVRYARFAYSRNTFWLGPPARRVGYLHRARNLVWALLIQALLNDDKRDRYLENFGTGLVMEADYNELLRTLASTRARFLIAEAISDQRSRDLLAAQNYGFLRTKAVFNRCMDVAWDKYRWKKLPL